MTKFIQMFYCIRSLRAISAGAIFFLGPSLTRLIGAPVEQFRLDALPAARFALAHGGKVAVALRSRARVALDFLLGQSEGHQRRERHQRQGQVRTPHNVSLKGVKEKCV